MSECPEWALTVKTTQKAIEQNQTLLYLKASINPGKITVSNHSKEIFANVIYKLMPKT